MFPGFEKIIEERIQVAYRRGDFDDLPGAGCPLTFEDDRHIPEDLRMAYKILKNADCIPPEIQLKKDISQTRDLLVDMPDTRHKYRLMKKLNVMIMKLNAMRRTPIMWEESQVYAERILERMESSTARNAASARP